MLADAHVSPFFQLILCQFQRSDPYFDPKYWMSLYQQGMLFVGDLNSKGEVFKLFLEKIQGSPKKIVFIDDKMKNVQDLENALAGSGITHIGVHYTAIDHVPPIYSRELAEFQYKHRHIPMSNEEAAWLISEAKENTYQAGGP